MERLSTRKTIIQMRELHFRNILRFWHNNCRKINRINWWQTLRFNFMVLPLKTAIKLPVLLYGKCKLGVLRGDIIFLSQPYKGMLKIGITDPFRSIECTSYISFTGTMYLGKEVTLRRGIHINISGTLTLNDYVSTGDCVSIMVEDKITLGHGVGIGNNTSLMDTDFHCVINLQTRVVKKYISAIEIGDNCWIGGNCVIKKGTKIPKGTIVAGPFSMLSKDYTTIIPEYSLIAGSPAKLLIKGVRRVKNLKSESWLSKYFANSKNSAYTLPQDIDIDSFCLPK